MRISPNPTKFGVLDNFKKSHNISGYTCLKTYRKVHQCTSCGIVLDTHWEPIYYGPRTYKYHLIPMENRHTNPRMYMLLSSLIPITYPSMCSTRYPSRAMYILVPLLDTRRDQHTSLVVHILIPLLIPHRPYIPI